MAEPLLSEDVPAAKAAMRRRMKALRAPGDPALGIYMAPMVLRDCLPPEGAVVGAFMSLPDEIDTVPLLMGLVWEGYEIALPVTPAAPGPLVFRRWRPGAKMIKGRFGTMHSEGVVMHPDFLLVPLLAFDGRGNRLGYGGGFYDRTLAARPEAFRLGCARAAQEVDAVPAEAHDLPLDAVATEHGVRHFHRRHIAQG